MCAWVLYIYFVKCSSDILGYHLSILYWITIYFPYNCKYKFEDLNDHESDSGECVGLKQTNKQTNTLNYKYNLKDGAGVLSTYSQMMSSTPIMITAIPITITNSVQISEFL